MQRVAVPCGSTAPATCVFHFAAGAAATFVVMLDEHTPGAAACSSSPPPPPLQLHDMGLNVVA
jgi:hypothetical protein